MTLALSSGPLALGLLAVQLLPLAEALPHTLEHPLRKFWYASQPRSLPPAQSLSRLTPQVMPYAVGVSGQSRLVEGFIEPSAYGGALLFPLAFAGLFARGRERWIFAALGLLGLAVAVKTPVADALAKLPLFDIALNERLVFLTVFSLCVLAALGAQRLRDGEGAPAFFAGTGATLVLLGILFTRVRPRVLALGMPPAALTERFLLQIVPLLLAAAVLAFLSRRRRATAGLAALVLLLAASRRLEVGATHPVMPLSTFYPPMRVLEKIPRGEPWRIAGVGERALIPNASAVYGLEDVRGYAAMTLLRFSETFPLWCEAQPVWFNRIDDPTRPFLSFLNVRWVLTEPSVAAPPGWPVLAEADGLRLLENPAALPRVFVPRTVRVERDPARRRELLKSIDDFSARGLVESDGASGEWKENGPARLEIAAYSSDALDVDVEASAETLVGDVPDRVARVEGPSRRSRRPRASLQPRVPRVSRATRAPSAVASLFSRRGRARSRRERRDASAVRVPPFPAGPPRIEAESRVARCGSSFSVPSRSTAGRRPSCCTWRTASSSRFRARPRSCWPARLCSSRAGPC